MCVAEAKIVLTRPVFGESKCISAVAVCRLAEQVKACRELGEEFCSLEGATSIEEMDTADLIRELEEWANVGVTA